MYLPCVMASQAGSGHFGRSVVNGCVKHVVCKVPASIAPLCMLALTWFCPEPPALSAALMLFVWIAIEGSVCVIPLLPLGLQACGSFANRKLCSLFHAKADKVNVGMTSLAACAYVS